MDAAQTFFFYDSRITLDFLTVCWVGLLILKKWLAAVMVTIVMILQAGKILSMPSWWAEIRIYLIVICCFVAMLWLLMREVHDEKPLSSDSDDSKRPQ